MFVSDSIAELFSKCHVQMRLRRAENVSSSKGYKISGCLVKLLSGKINSLHASNFLCTIDGLYDCDRVNDFRVCWGISKNNKREGYWHKIGKLHLNIFHHILVSH